MALWVEETKNQTESQHIKSNIGFSWEGKTRVPGEKPLLKIRVEKQQSQPTYHYHHGSGNWPWAILVESRCSHQYPNFTEKMMMKMIMIATTNNKPHDLAMLLLPDWFIEHEQALASFTWIHIARTRVQVSDYSSCSGSSQQVFRAK